MNAAIYLRRSTNEKLQADSLKVQEQILREYARAHDMTVAVVIADSASGSTAVRRPGFMKLVKLITGEPSFDVVLVRDVSRFGRFFDVDEGAYWDVLFRAHGVRTIYCEEAFGQSDSLIDNLSKSIRRVMASEFVRDRSRSVRYSQSRVVRQGFLHGGPPPYGMARMMVTLDGKPVEALERGQWKGLANRRTKLVPGNIAEVATVQRIFRRYATEGATLEAIASELNTEGLPSPHRKKWAITTVRDVLQNERYVGDVHYRPRKKRLLESLPDDLLASLEAIGINAHAGIVDRDTWEAAQRRQCSATRHRTNDDLAQELRRAFEQTGFVTPKLAEQFLVPFCWGTLAIRFNRGPVQALELAYSDVISKRWDSLETLIQGTGSQIDRAAGRLSQPDYGVTVGVRLAVPYSTKQGVLVRFDTSRSTDDALMFTLMTKDGPEPGWFLFSRDAHGRHPRGHFFRRDSRRFRAHRVTDLQLGKELSRLRLASREKAENAFLRAARRQGRLNLCELARELDWSYGAVSRCYRIQLEKGEWLPPLMKTRGRRIAFVCARCGECRSLRPSEALVLKGDVCPPCRAALARRRTIIRCPDCAIERCVKASVYRKLSNGGNTRCKRCSARHQYRRRARAPKRC